MDAHVSLLCWAKRRIVEPARIWDVQSIKELRVCDVLYADAPYVCAREEAEADAVDGRGHWMGRVGHQKSVSRLEAENG
jgi:hypothetical protein